MPPLVAPETAPLAVRPATDLAPLSLAESPAAVYLARLAPSGRRTQQQALATIATMLQHSDLFTCPWERLRYAHTAAIHTALAERYAPSTTNKMLSALRGVLEECWNLGLITREEFERAAKVKSIKANSDEQAGRALTLEELTALLEACARDASPLGVRDAALIAVMAQGGPRRSEVVALQLKDYTPTTGQLVIRKGKGNKFRTIYVTGGAQIALNDWLVLRGNAPGPIFTATTRSGAEGMTDQAVLVILRKRATEAGVSRFSPHDLRRTCATTLLENDADVISVQRLMGHSDPKTTARYDRRKEKAKQQAASKFELPIVPNIGRRTLSLDD